MPARILVPLDRSSLAEQALAEAVELAVAHRATLRLVHCWPARIAYGDTFGPMVDVSLERRDDAEAYLARVAAPIRALGLTVETALLSLPIADELCDDARGSRVDLIVMSTHGRTGWSRFWLGSVADAVCRQSPVPVLLRKSSEEGTRVSVAAIGQQVLVPLDGSPVAEQVLGPLVQVLGPLQPRIRLLRVVHPVHAAQLATANGVPIVEIDEPGTQRALREAEETLDACARRLHDALPRSVIETRAVIDESAARVIVEASEQVDLVALATHGRGASRLLFGSVTDKVLRAAHAAMLIVRRHAEAAPTLPAAEGAGATRPH
ncbi:MAG TPA: universal stress protein [Gemmatimonadaceae bacterium]|nr:universal stress protein [Gemmatimonadaceae bacterium]